VHLCVSGFACEGRVNIPNTAKCWRRLLRFCLLPLLSARRPSSSAPRALDNGHMRRSKEAARSRAGQGLRGEYRWRLKVDNGKVVADSAKSYTQGRRLSGHHDGDLARDLEAVASKPGVPTERDLLMELLRRVRRIEERLGIEVPVRMTNT
jgi:hypothetical protein